MENLKPWTFPRHCGKLEQPWTLELTNFVSEHDSWDFPGRPVVKTALPMQRIQVQSLVGELRSYRPFSVAKNKTKHQNLVLLPIKRFFFNCSEPQLPHLQDACCSLSLSQVRLFGTPWTGAHQASLSMRILQARILEWVAMLSSRDLPNPRVKPRFPALQTHSLPLELPEKSKNTGVGSQPIPSPGDLPNPGITPRSPALEADSLPTELSGKPFICRMGTVQSLSHRVTGQIGKVGGTQ